MARRTMAQALLSTTIRPAQIRTGTVSAVTATTLDVIVGGTTITAAYIDGYAAVVGDLVVIGSQDASWVVFGKQAGVGPNLVENPGFEDGGEGPGTPVDWFLYDEVGTAALQVVEQPSAPEGSFVLQADPDASARTTVVYSQPFAAEPGWQFALSAFAGGVTLATGDVELHLLGFANNTNLMPTTTSDVTAASVLNVAEPTPYTSISGTATVPAGGTLFARVGLRSVLATTVGMQWDFAICRRIA
jgi:hypothetical protein